MGVLSPKDARANGHIGDCGDILSGSQDFVTSLKTWAFCLVLFRVSGQSLGFIWGLRFRDAIEEVRAGLLPKSQILKPELFPPTSQQGSPQSPPPCKKGSRLIIKTLCYFAGGGR